jgi:hypothetical protein
MRHIRRRRLGIGLGAALAIAGLGAAAPSGPTNSLPNPYRSIENWGTLPQGRAWGSTSAVAIDPDGTSVWVGERCGDRDRRRRSIPASHSAATARSSIRSSNSMHPASCSGALVPVCCCSRTAFMWIVTATSGSLTALAAATKAIRSSSSAPMARGCHARQTEQAG